jgi:hypothetical protein
LYLQLKTCFPIKSYPNLHQINPNAPQPLHQTTFSHPFYCANTDSQRNFDHRPPSVLGVKYAQRTYPKHLTIILLPPPMTAESRASSIVNSPAFEKNTPMMQQ